MGKLDGRVACITAGTRSIGRGIAEAFLAEGAKVVVSGRSVDKGMQAVAEMGGDNVHFIQCDATKQADVEALVDGTVEHFGRVDISVFNAGGVDQTSMLADFTDEEWQYELDFNINHCFWGLRRSLKYMIPQQYGRIMLMSSMYGKIVFPGVGGYMTNKHAIIGLTKAAAHEVGQMGITVNAICPGFVATDLFYESGPKTVEGLGLENLDALAAIMYAPTAIKRANTVEEVGALATLLASHEGGGFTGSAYNVDGGAAPY
jgi:NAD(P)-dependent dehydrogenase (short-subunit alcohol dehydrogenase family)